MGNNPSRDESSRLFKVVAFLRAWRALLIVSAGLLMLLILTIIAIQGVAFSNVYETEQEANANNSNAQLILGRGYETGNLESYSLGTVGTDLSKAAYWYSRSAKLGNNQASFCLAGMYERNFSGTATRSSGMLGPPNLARRMPPLV